jgi:hypothetical protein
MFFVELNVGPASKGYGSIDVIAGGDEAYTGAGSMFIQAGNEPSKKLGSSEAVFLRTMDLTACTPSQLEPSTEFEGVTATGAIE